MLHILQVINCFWLLFFNDVRANDWNEYEKYYITYWAERNIHDEKDLENLEKNCWTWIKATKSSSEPRCDMVYLYCHNAFTQDFDVERVLGHHQLPSDVADLTIRLYSFSFYVHDVFMSLITDSTEERVLLKVYL